MSPCSIDTPGKSVVLTSTRVISSQLISSRMATGTKLCLLRMSRMTRRRAASVSGTSVPTASSVEEMSPTCSATSTARYVGRLIAKGAPKRSTIRPRGGAKSRRLMRFSSASMAKRLDCATCK